MPRQPAPQARRLGRLRHHLDQQLPSAAAAPTAAADDDAAVFLARGDGAGGPVPRFQYVTSPDSSPYLADAFAKAAAIGVQHKTFESSAFGGRRVGYNIYLPPGYAESDEPLAVIYNLHGASGNEHHSFEDVKCLHEGIIAGRWAPMIMVLPNGGTFTQYRDSYDGAIPAGTFFVEDLLPHIDREYRTIAGRHGRCVEGYSMGGYGATHLAVKHPELFCSSFNQAGTVTHVSEMGGMYADSPGWDSDSWESYLHGYLGPDKAFAEDNDAFVLLARNIDAIRGKVRMAIACGTQDDRHLPTVRDFHEALVAAEVDHTYIECATATATAIATAAALSLPLRGACMRFALGAVIRYVLSLPCLALPCCHCRCHHCDVRYEEMAHEGSIAMMALNRAQWFDYHAVSLAIAQENLGKEEQEEEEELAGSILPAVGKTDLHIIYLAYTLGRC